MHSSLFGDKSRFAVEIRFDLKQSDPWLYGLFFYWIEDKRIGKQTYFNLTDVFDSMKWVYADCGRRDGGALCKLPPIRICRWVKAVIFDDDLASLDFDVEGLPSDVAKYNLLFHPVNGTDWVLLVACGSSGMLIYAPATRSPVVITDKVQVFEETIKDAYLFLASLHEQVNASKSTKPI